ncbi:MAG: hypothetical protein KFW07_01385 [Mycoplasmataceae bacterium]|nr:hypothetical protein [Mycoplasmataceae bacterium]
MEDKNTNSRENVQSNLGKPVNFEPKSVQEGKKFAGTLSYEDIISQTKEIAFTAVRTEKDLIEEDSKRRIEKINALDEHFNDLNAKPLSSIDSYESYNLVLNKSVWNYNEISQRNTKFSIKDLVLQTHIYIYDGVIIHVDEIEKTLSNFLQAVLKKIILGYPVVLNPVLIIDVIRFDKSKIIPVAIANPKLLPPIGIIEWNSLVKNEGNNYLIIDAFIKLLDNALSNGHEVEFFEGTLLVRGISGITSLFVEEKAAVSFNNLVLSLASNQKKHK